MGSLVSDLLHIDVFMKKVEIMGIERIIGVHGIILEKAMLKSESAECCFIVLFIIYILHTHTLDYNN
jgi:hypothetical protein